MDGNGHDLAIYMVASGDTRWRPCRERVSWAWSVASDLPLGWKEMNNDNPVPLFSIGKQSKPTSLKDRNLSLDSHTFRPC